MRNFTRTPFAATLLSPFLVLCLAAAAEAQGLLNQISAKVNDIQSRVNQIQLNASAAITAIRDGLSDLTAEMRAEITSALAEAQAELAEVRADRVDFLANAAQFRTDFSDVLLAMEGISNEVSLITGTRFSLEFDKERTAIQSLPTAAVAPFYRAVAAGGRVDFTALKTGLADVQSALATARPVLTGDCNAAVQQRAGVEQATGTLTKVSMVVRLIAKVLDAKGETGVSSKPIQIHGYVGLEIMNNRTKKLGKVLDGVGGVLGEVNSFLSNKLRFCVLEVGQETILSQLATLNIDASNMDAPVSTRASQASVDQVAAALGQIDAKVSSRASQASVDALLQHLGAPLPTGPTSVLRILVEQQLDSHARPAAVFYLPETLGGMLEMVRQIVGDVITTARLAGITVEKALSETSAGDDAYGRGEYRDAYMRYANAYRSLW